MKTLIIAMLTGTFAVLTNPLFSAPTSDSTSSPPASTANQVEVVGSDYAFRIPSELRAGVTTFHFRNDGTARHELTILAYEMNGMPLSVLHGAPLRLRCENELGFKMVKWIAAIEFVHDFADLGAGQGGYNEDHEFYGYRMPI